MLPGLTDPVAVLEEVAPYTKHAFVEQLRYSAAPKSISTLVDGQYPELKGLYPAPDSYWKNVEKDSLIAGKRLGIKVEYVKH